MNRKFLEYASVIIFSIINSLLAFLFIVFTPAEIIPYFPIFGKNDPQFLVFNILAPAILPSILFVVKGVNKVYYFRLLIWSYIFLLAIYLLAGLGSY